MFNRLSSILHLAVEATTTHGDSVVSLCQLNPTVPLQEEFIRHWKIITNYFIECTDENKPVSETKIPEHLQQMLTVLIKEEKEGVGDETGPCMEYTLRHKILKAMVTLAIANKILCMIANTELAFSENEEVEFVWAICQQVRNDPSLVDLFIQPPRKGGASTADNPNNNQDELLMDSNTNGRHSLVEALVKLSKSEDTFVFERASEGLMLCTSLQSEQSAIYVVLYTRFCDVVAENLVKQYKLIPRRIAPDDVLNCPAKWGGKTVKEELIGENFPGKQQLLSFLSYLYFLDKLCAQAHQLVARAVGKSIREQFLIAILEPRLLEPAEEGTLTSIAHLTRCLILIQSEYLIHEFAVFILGDNLEPERRLGPSENQLRHKMIHRCDHLNEKISAASMKLFEVLLQKPDQYILDNLIIRNVIKRSYYDLSSNVHSFAKIALINNSLEGNNGQDEEYTQKVVNCFLSLMPDLTKSSDGSQDEYETYLKDAYRQHTSRTIQSITWSWPHEIISSINLNESDEFYEGEFLNVLFNKLQRILDQPYEVNLQVTSVISVIVQFHHPYLHEYMLDPLLPLKDGSRSLYTVLQQIVNELQKRIARIPEFKKMVHISRQSLLGSELPNTNSPVNKDLLEGTIVLEEFCKEIAAITYVKSKSPLRKSHIDS
ncbi:uncharacterized protein TRIADDRAFT_58480 [Trichoplax adhaerens]|uniref:FHF complex subunit HOOK-interacting protein C-terminal domain-containing protein n=1 Tax=Trichoplax adhaerens TaxID=10228 RepID=B3S2U1_TRIAD|nr:hypothetical protein TRIADDRAFT_58480 [Trichoplax adhaerens]EDV22680.1 hypothetical protein TRIADDRAFT_58480 [Trichoplax adhaerens]|eukprot:XP_002114546.1 hypothetical protein TRIADDRAFT_58480 [Trichoplax adhaerens]